MTNALYILGLLLAFGIVGNMDYAEEMRQEAERQSIRADLNRAALVACLNGGAPGLFIEQADGSRNYLVCDRPYEVSDKNVKHRRTS